MQVHATKAAIRAAALDWQRGGARVGLVPTMGYLHDGHLSLVRAAQAACNRVIVSIFVNPTQFGPKEDLSTYPRDLARDLDLLRAAGVDAVFTPEVAEIYPQGAETVVETTKLARMLMGRLRPGHFRGVATVVTKLFNITQADQAFFGEKDFQQLAVIRRMVADLDMKIAITGVPTLREGDGLAMSSRNVRLTPADREEAPVLFRALQAAAAQALTLSAKDILVLVRTELAQSNRGEVRSVDLRDAVTLAPVSGRLKAPAVLLLAVKFGNVLLIDNMVIGPR